MNRKKISQFALALQNQEIVPLWAIANDLLIANAALQKKHIWGKKSKKIYNLMKILSSLKISNILIFMVGFYQILHFFIKAHRKKTLDENLLKSFNKIFVCHGANAEEYIFNQYLEQSRASVLKINIITMEGVDRIKNISSIKAIFLLVASSFGLSKKIVKLSREMNLNKFDFLTQSALNIGEYVFFRCLFFAAKLEGINEAVFLALHVASHSCIHEKMRMTYWSHGLIKLSILMAKPNNTLLVTPEEEKYLNFVFNSKINCKTIKKYEAVVGKKNNSIVVLSPEIVSSFSKCTQDNYFNFLKWAQLCSLKIILRPSPKNTYFDLLRLKQDHPHFDYFDDLKSDIDKSLMHLMPKMIVGFNNTGLFTALNMGFLPISFCEPDSEAILNAIYPLKQRVLFWPRDKSIIDSIISCDIMYNSQILKLKNNVEIELYE